MVPPVWQTLGTHRYYVQDDLLFVELQGVLAKAECDSLFAAVVAIEKGYGDFLSLFDARGASGMTADARRHVGQWTRSRRSDRAIAVAGASFPIRTIVTMLQNAARLFGKPVPPAFFVATVEDAMRQLVTERQRLSARQASKPPPHPPLP